MCYNFPSKNIYVSYEGGSILPDILLRNMKTLLSYVIFLASLLSSCDLCLM